MNTTKIDWADFTFNPIVGCKHNCSKQTTGYECYAEKCHNMRHKAYLEGKKLPIQYAKPFNEPQFFPERLNSKIPKLPKERNPIAELIATDKPVIFVGSMADNFGGWVQMHWIMEVVEYCKDKDAIFMFLTKGRYPNIKFPDNCILGVTIESEDKLRRLDHLRYFKHRRKFVSIEPILSGFKDVDFSGIEFAIIGAETGKGSEKPSLDWVESVNAKTIYTKRNLRKIYPSLPVCLENIEAEE